MVFVEFAQLDISYQMGNVLFAHIPARLVLIMELVKLVNSLLHCNLIVKANVTPVQFLIVITVLLKNHSSA